MRTLGSIFIIAAAFFVASEAQAKPLSYYFPIGDISPVKLELNLKATSPTSAGKASVALGEKENAARQVVYKALAGRWADIHISSSAVGASPDNPKNYERRSVMTVTTGSRKAAKMLKQNGFTQQPKKSLLKRIMQRRSR